MFNLENNANKDWESWKHYLRQAMEFASELGIPQGKIQSLAQQAGSILAENVTPANDEQKVLKELWDVADNSERQVIANLMTKVVSR